MLGQYVDWLDKSLPQERQMQSTKPMPAVQKGSVCVVIQQTK